MSCGDSDNPTSTNSQPRSDNNRISGGIWITNASGGITGSCGNPIGPKWATHSSTDARLEYNSEDLPNFAMGIPYPNPAPWTVGFDFYLRIETDVRLTATRIMGPGESLDGCQNSFGLGGIEPTPPVMEFTDSEIIGFHTFYWRPEGLPQGFYRIVFSADNGTFSDYADIYIDRTIYEENKLGNNPFLNCLQEHSKLRFR